MTDAPKDNRRALDVVLAGYLLDAEMLKYLCIASYGATAAELKTRSPVDFASCYYNERDVLDAPWLVPVRYYSKSNPDEPEQRWVLPGRAAFFVADTEPPKLPFDQETKTYLNAWFPPRLLKMPAFEGIRYYQTYWPRGWPVTGIVLTKLRMRNREYRIAREKHQQKYVDYHKSKGRMNVKAPIQFPVSWHLD